MNRVYALGRLKPGAMNKTEAAYDQHLALLQRAGTIECHEVKGFWTDDARVKVKVAADQYPFRFIAIKALPKKQGGGWAAESFE